MSTSHTETLSLTEPSARPRRYATAWRIALLLVLSLLLHAVLLGALPGLPVFKSEESPPIEATIELPPPPAPPPVAAKPVAPPIQHHVAAKPQPVPETAPAPPALFAPHGVPMGLSSDPAPSDAGTLVASASAAAPEAAAAQPAPPIPPIPPAPPAARPVDSVLEYDVVALDPKKPDQSLIGHGTLNFHTDAASYHASLEARVSLLFISLSVLSSQSSGTIGADGLEPLSYTEAQRNKPTGSASIAHDANGNPSTISYGSGDSVPAPPGVQDHLSVLLQVGGLMQSNPALCEPGARFVVPVLGTKGAVEPWNFAVIGRESVATPRGTADAWHVMRILRPGSNDRGIEVWVGDHPAGVPLRVRYTEPSGSTIDLKLD